MELKTVQINYDLNEFEPQVTKAVKISQAIKVNHWVTLQEGDVVFFKQTFKGKNHPHSTASYEMYINGKSGGGGTQNILINLLDTKHDDKAKSALENFYKTIKGVLAETTDLPQ